MLNRYLYFWFMKNLLPSKFQNFKLPTKLQEASKRMESLLPASTPKTAAQLPLPGTPFDHYRRNKLIQLMDFKRYVGERTVLEVGCGIGDLLKEMSKFGPKELYGVDSSQEALDFAAKYLEGIEVDLSMADARKLPFPDKSFDVVIVMYELQHIADDRSAQRVVDEVARVARHWAILIEETAQKKYQLENITRRPVDFYKEAFKKANMKTDVLKNDNNRRFHLRKSDYLHVSASSYIFTGTSNPWHWIRWLFSPLLYLMGFPPSVMKLPTQSRDLPTSKLAMTLQQWALPFTNSLDNIYKANDGTTVMWFEREKLFRKG